MELDHVLIPLADLSGAVSEFEGRYGLVSVEGGRHADWGTAEPNRSARRQLPGVDCGRRPC